MSVLSFLAGVLSWVASQAGVLGFLPKAVQALIPIAAAALAAIGIRGASANPFTDLLNKTPTGVKTVLGIVVAVIGALLAPDVLSVLPATVAKIVTDAGAVLAAIGLYHAQATKAQG